MRGIRFDRRVVLAAVALVSLTAAGALEYRRRLLIEAAASDENAEKITNDDAATPVREAFAHGVPLPLRAFTEIIVLSNASAESVDAVLASPGKFAHDAACGDPAACDRVRTFYQSADFKSERRPREDIELPHADVMESIAPALSPDDRVRALGARWAVTLRGSEPATPDAIALRAVGTLSVALAISGERDGAWIYDVANRRIESSAEYARHMVVEPLGSDLLRADRLYVHRYDDGENATRLLTLGMRSFALPDLMVGPCAASDAPALANLLHDVEEHLAHERATPANVAPPAPNAPVMAPFSVGRARLDLRHSPRREGDPENLLYWLTPAEATAEPTAADYARLAATVREDEAHAREAIKQVADEAALGRTRKAASASFAGALVAWKKTTGAKLQIEAPFRNDGDAGPAEYMWIDVDSVDKTTIDGRLASTPALVRSHKPGDAVHLARAELFDWLVILPDGKTLTPPKP
jgi:uncharacterized protein YegJ (DUF2314 family)